MNDLMARATAVVGVLLLAGALGVVWYTSNPQATAGQVVTAEFEDAYPLLPGMHVRMYGAVAGEITDVSLSDEGNAVLTLSLHEGTETIRKGATATSRQEDITGDSYVSLSPGNEREPLGDETIPVERTMVAPRFDDLLNSFDEPLRQGIEMMLVELGKTLERRGLDLNRAALKLRPALAAANQALSEVNSQNEAVQALIEDAEQVTGQAAGRSDQLGELIDGLAATLRTTAKHAPALDRALEAAPETLARGRGTVGRLSRLAEAAQPLADSLGAAAPELARGANLLSPFLDDARAILDDVEPTLDLTIELLRRSLPTLRANPRRAFTAPFDVAAGAGRLLDTLLGDQQLLRSLFGADTYGGAEPGNFDDDVGLGSVGVEPGNQAGYPADYDELRRFLRAKPVASCEMFGRPIEPGCLADVLSGLLSGGETGKAARRGKGGMTRDVLAGRVRESLDEIVGEVGSRLERRLPRDAKTTEQLKGLLEYLLGP